MACIGKGLLIASACLPGIGGLTIFCAAISEENRNLVFATTTTIRSILTVAIAITLIVCPVFSFLIVPFSMALGICSLVQGLGLLASASCLGSPGAGILLLLPSLVLMAFRVMAACFAPPVLPIFELISGTIVVLAFGVGACVSLRNSRPVPVAREEFESTIQMWVNRASLYPDLQVKERDFPVLWALSDVQKRELVRFLVRVESIEDYKRESTRNIVVEQVHQMLCFAEENSAFREKMSGIIQDALAACNDRVALCLDEIGIQLKLESEMRSSTDAKWARFCIGLHRVELLEKEAKRICALRVAGDLVDISLSLRCQLRDSLDLPCTAQTLFFSGLGVTEQEVEQVKQTILSCSSSQEQRIEILEGLPPWIAKIRASNEESFGEIQAKTSGYTLQAIEQDENLAPIWVAIEQQLVGELPLHQERRAKLLERANRPGFLSSRFVCDAAELLKDIKEAVLVRRATKASLQAPRAAFDAEQKVG